jgi:hypothetical protein
LIITAVTGVRWNLNVVLICISFMVKNVEHHLMCLLVIRTSSLENFLFNSIGLFLLLCLILELLIYSRY